MKQSYWFNRKTWLMKRMLFSWWTQKDVYDCQVLSDQTWFFIAIAEEITCNKYLFLSRRFALTDSANERDYWWRCWWTLSHLLPNRLSNLFSFSSSTRSGSRIGGWKTNANASQSHGPTLQSTPIPQWPRRFFRHAQIPSEWLRTELMGMLSSCRRCQSWHRRCQLITFPTRHTDTHHILFHLRNSSERRARHRRRLSTRYWTEASRDRVRPTTGRWAYPSHNVRRPTTSFKAHRRSTQRSHCPRAPIKATTTAAASTISVRRATTTALLSRCHRRLKDSSWPPRNHPPHKPFYLRCPRSPNCLNLTNRRRSKTIKILE